MWDFSLIYGNTFYGVIIMCTAIGGTDSALVVEKSGRATSGRELCIGANLTFRCSISVSSYAWTVTGFLDGYVGNGRITLGETLTVGEFTLSASGAVTANNDTRRSSLQVTTFEGLVGERTVTCIEPGNPFNSQTATITVLDYPLAPTISDVTTTTNPPSFTLTIQPPSARAMCVGGQYQLTIRSSSPDSSEQSVTRVIPVADPPVTLSYVVDSSVVPNFNVCNSNYSFEMAVAVNTGTTNQQNGEFEYGERGSFTVKDLCNSDISVVANTSLEECSNVAVLVIDRVRNNDMRFATRMTTVIGEGVLEFSGSTDQHMCKAHIKLPSGLRLSFPSFNCGTTPPITATDHVMETPSTTSLCYQYIVSNGILAGALTVALVIIVTLVVIVALLIVKIKKIKLQKFDNQEHSTQYEIVKDRNIVKKKDISPGSKGGDISMVQCQAYGEVGVKTRAGASDANNSGGLYEDV